MSVLADAPTTSTRSRDISFEPTSISSLVIKNRFALPGTRLVRAFSPLGYHQLDEDTRPASAADRHAIAIAGDDPRRVRDVADLVDRLGSTPSSPAT